MKKEYMNPTLLVVERRQKTSLLAGSVPVVTNTDGNSNVDLGGSDEEIPDEEVIIR